MTIYQVMEAMDVGDAVSNIARRNAALLGELGQSRPILARYTHPSVEHETRPCHTALATPDCAFIFHYWGENASTWMLDVFRGRKAVHYHNITPPHFFPHHSELHRQLARGYAQLARIADAFDLVVADSEYNAEEFCRYTKGPKPTLHLYPIVDAPETPAPSGQDAPHVVDAVFVGRVVRNKRQDRLMRVFDRYCRNVNRNARLWLIGNDRVDPDYRVELERLRGRLRSGDRIHFTGKLDDAELVTRLRSASLFLCASEHEGFCMPIAQAMAFDVPVIAYAAAALPETMGEAGLLVRDWDEPRVAELMHLAVTDEALRGRVLASQRANLKRFSESEARRRLAAIIAYLRTGEPSPLFVHRGPT